MIGTPTIDGKVGARYTSSLLKSSLICQSEGNEIYPFFLKGESILPMARNLLLQFADENDFDALIFIDADQFWKADAIQKLIDLNLDVVGHPVVNKDPKRRVYNVWLEDSAEDIANSLSPVLSARLLGTGFLLLSKHAIRSLIASSRVVNFRGSEVAEVFGYTVEDENFIGEDASLCKKLNYLGFKVWCDTTETIGHEGTIDFVGDFEGDLQTMLNNTVNKSGE